MSSDNGKLYDLVDKQSLGKSRDMCLNLASVLQFLTWRSRKQFVFSSKDHSITGVVLK